MAHTSRRYHHVQLSRSHEKRGRLADEDRQRFPAAGFSAEQILEVVAVVAASTITNYTGSVTEPPLETQFAEFAWHAPTR